MDQVIAALRNGRKIEAIKAFRSLYHDPIGGMIGLKEAKDACEAILAAMVPVEPFIEHDNTEYVVVTVPRYQDEPCVSEGYETKADAMRSADLSVEHSEKVIVARVVARSVTTRRMQAC